jgi:adenylate cyclase
MEERRIVAIVVSDISGYTSLMGENEQKALQILKTNQLIHHSLIKEHHGKIIEEVGDGTYACFYSVKNAAVYAADLMNHTSGEQGYFLHIGMHLSEVVVSGDKVYGEGLKLASMIQSAARSAEILISGPVFRNIHNMEGVKAEFVGKRSFETFGELDLYNLDINSVSVNAEKLPSAAGGTGIGKKRNKNSGSGKIVWITAAALLITIAVYLVFRISKSSVQSNPDKLVKSIGVLPFRNEGNEEEMKYFSNGVMESILNNLAKISALRVTSRTSTERYRDTSLPVRIIAHQLDVNYLLEGSVQKYGRKVRIVVQLVNAIEDKHVWSETYDREFTDILNLQSEIAKSVAGRMNTIITPREKDLIEKPPTANLDAYDMYVRGRELTYLYSNTKNENYLTQAMRFFNQAIQSDSRFALPYFGMGALYLYRYGFLSEKFLEKDFADSVMQLCNRAIELDPDLGEAYCLRGYYKYFEKDYRQAIDDQEKALSLNPNLSLAYLNLGVIYEGAFNDKFNGLKYLKKAELREKNGMYLGSILTNIGNIYLSLNDTAKAAFYFRKTLKVLPGNFWASDGLACIAMYFNNDTETALAYADTVCRYYPDPYYCNAEKGKVYSFMKDFKKANESYEKVREVNRLNRWILFNSSYLHGYVLWNLGQRKEAMQYFRDQIEYCNIKDRQYSSAEFDLAGTYSFLGQKDKALATLNHFVDKGFFGIGSTGYRIQADPLFDNIRGTPEFRVILKKGREELLHKRSEIERSESSGLL